MKDNRGLTLVELLITVTILALVIAGAASFLLAGSRSFAKGSADSNVQGEAELAVNQIEDLIIDINGGVDFTDDTSASTLTMYHVETDNSGVAATLNKKRTVTWNKADKKLYSGEWDVTKDPTTGAYTNETRVYDGQLLAENVTDFNVDLSDKYTETAKDGTDIEIVRSVVIRVDCLDGTGKSTYATTPTITLRNRLLISSSPDEIFENTPSPDDSLLLYISNTGMEGALPIRDRVTTVERGKVYNIFAMVSVGTNVNSLCNFTVEGEASGTASSITPEGVHIALDVNESEPNDYLKITATYKDNPAKTVSGWVKVIGGAGKSLDWVKIIPLSDLSVYTVHYDSAYHTTGFTEEEEALLEYKWEVVDAGRVEAGFKNTEKTLDLTIIQKSENYNQQLCIILTLYSPTTNQTVQDRIYYNIPPEGTVGGDSIMERGKGISDYGGYDYGAYGTNWYSFKPPIAKGNEWQCKITGYDYNLYYIYYLNGKEELVEVEDESLKDHVTIWVNRDVYDGLWAQQDVGYWLTVDQGLPADRAFYIRVNIYFEYANGTTWNYSRLHYITNVQLYGGTSTATVNNTVIESDGTIKTWFKNWGGGFDFHYTVIGYHFSKWTKEPYPFDYDITYDYEAPAGVTIEPIKQGASEDHAGEGSKGFYGSAGFNVINNSGRPDYEVEKEMKMKSATIKIYMKEYPSVSTYCYVKFD